MLTQGDGPVDGAPRAVMWPIKQIAERDGISKQAVSRAVARLIAQHGLQVERDAHRHVQAVNVAQYDHLRGQFRDPTKDQRPPPRGAPPPGAGNDSFDEATRQRAWLATEREKIALAERKRELVRKDGVAEALVEAGADIARVLERGVNAVDDLAAAVARDGAHGLRVGLKKLFARMGGEIADALGKVAAEAPAVDPADEAEVGVQESAAL